jgi:AcrR family transcriptional regulator
MTPAQESKQALGLRERKNLQTREAIVRASFELVIEFGYEGATIAKIAERADVAPRTIHTIFAGKDEILLWHADDHITRLETHLTSGEGTTIDRVRAWLVDEAGRLADGDDDLRKLRIEAYAADMHLQALEYSLRRRAESLIAEAELRLRPGGDPAVASVVADGLGGAIMGVLLSMERGVRERGSLAEGEFDQALVALGRALSGELPS